MKNVEQLGEAKHTSANSQFDFFEPIERAFEWSSQ